MGAAVDKATPLTGAPTATRREPSRARPFPPSPFQNLPSRPGGGARLPRLCGWSAVLWPPGPGWLGAGPSPAGVLLTESEVRQTRVHTTFKNVFS